MAWGGDGRRPAVIWPRQSESVLLIFMSGRPSLIVGTKWLVILMAVFVLTSPSHPQSQSEFRWLKPQRDQALWGNIRQAFLDELRPDPPDPSTLTYGYKYLKAVGVLNRSALVIIGYRTREHPKRNEEGAEFFRAFNYDFTTANPSNIESPQKGYPSDMFRWKLIKLTRFEPSPAPDIVFTYLTCWECEEERILSSFRYDLTKKQWEFRQWGNGRPLWWAGQIGIVVWEDVYGGSDTVSYDCLYGLVDFDHDGFDDVAVRCKEVTEPIKSRLKTNDSTVLYSLKNGHFKGAVVTDSQQRKQIWDELCKVDTQNALCRGVSKHK